ncbi:18200_t:CDS:2, partial [Funneliformis geosporum]
IEGNIEYDVEDESEIVKSDEHMEISFKLVIRKEEMVLKINIEKILKDFEIRFKELEQNNVELRSQFRELEVDTKAKQ